MFCRELLTELESDVNEPARGTSFVQHLFTAYWQYSQFKSCRLNPEEGNYEVLRHVAFDYILIAYVQ